jgi:acyl-CoA thioester hydrolase
MAKETPDDARRYRYFVPITTRWSDNDVYGHINNVAYYSYFDTAANHFLINQGGLDILGANVIGIVAESRCAYFQPLSYPEPLRAGVRVDKLGRSSVTYGVAIFRENEEQAAAQGHFVHVFVERKTNKPVPVPDRLRAALERIAASAP